jgi:predicted Na+-dependent transporter
LPVIDKITNILVLILLFEMTLATGLGVSLSDRAGVIRNVSLLARAELADYLMVPAAALLVLYPFHAKPLTLGRPIGDRWAFGLTTATRNVGVALVIATASFPESAAVSAVIVFAIFQIIGLVLIALLLGQVSGRTQPH